ncbi:MAG: aminotransferase class I/II-fold pyridoxal phosphate-dependent enzyme [Thermodesulfobacteriota bacterium]
MPFNLNVAGNTGPSSVQADLSFDSSRYRVIDVAASDAATSANKSVAWNKVADDKVRVMVFGGDQAMGSGVLATLNFVDTMGEGRNPSLVVKDAKAVEELEALAEVIIRRGIMVISDDIYEKIIYDDASPFYTMASLGEELKRISIVINGVSKTYAMTGWRIGYAAGDEQIIAAMTKYQSQNTSNPTSIAQKAAVEALNGSQESLPMMVREFQKRRDVIVAKLNAIPGVTCLKPVGAFYVFPNVSSFYGRSFEGRIITNSAEMAAYLLDESNVALVPGGDFGHDDHIRISYATSMEQIEKGVDRIREALRKLS